MARRQRLLGGTGVRADENRDRLPAHVGRVRTRAVRGGTGVVLWYYGGTSWHWVGTGVVLVVLVVLGWY